MIASNMISIAALILGAAARNTTLSTTSITSVGNTMTARTTAIGNDETSYSTRTRRTTTRASVDAAQTTVSLLWDGIADGVEYPDQPNGLSVVSADACATTFVTAKTNYGGDGHDDEDDALVTHTIVASASGYEQLFSTTVANSSTESQSLSCSVTGASSLKCLGTYMMSFDGSSVVQTYSYTSVQNATITPTGYPVTGGSEKLASATGTCTKHGNAAAPTGVMHDIYKVVIVPAAAVVAAALV